MRSRRSFAFEVYLGKQTPEYRRQLLQAEKEFAVEHDVRLQIAERDFEESMEGYTDEIAGAGPQNLGSMYLPYNGPRHRF